MKKLLVLGVGNLLLTDEGIGVHAVRDLAQEDWPQTAMDFVDGGTFTQDIFYLFQKYHHILVLDVVHGGKAPGTIYRLSETQLRSGETERLSLHDIDLLDSLQMAALLGNRPQLTVLGIEPLCISQWSMELTLTLAAIYPHYLEAARREIRAILASPPLFDKSQRSQ